MQRIQAKNGIAMTVAACLWLGLFPLLQRFSYARITLDKWLFMLALCGVTLLCCLIDIICRFTAARRDGNRALIASGPVLLLPVILGGLLLLWVVLSCLLSPYEADIWWIGASMRREGLATQLCYLGIFFCFIFGRVRLKPVLWAACGGVVLFAVVVLLQRHGGNPLGLYPAGRSYALNPEFQGTIGNIDMDTGYLCLISGFLLHGALRQFHTFRQDHSRSSLLAMICSLVALGLSIFLILTMQVQFGLITLAVLLAVTILRLLPIVRRSSLQVWSPCGLLSG